jgi:ATP-dependent DNA helicase RecG
VLSDNLSLWIREGESEHLAFSLFFGHESIETLTAFANLHGGVLLLGISELREIKGVPDAKDHIKQWLNEIQTKTTPRLFPHIEMIEIEEKTVVCISVAGYPAKPVACEGKYYKRFAKFNQELSIREAMDFRRQSLDSHWDSNIRRDKTIPDISFDKLYRLIERISRKKKCAPEEPLAFLRKYGLMEGDTVTNTCWLLLLPDETPETTIELGRYSSPTVTSDALTLKSDLFTEAEEAMQFICKHICKETETGEIQWQYPMEAVRELVVNMIIHRDYSSDYNSIIKIFDGHIEFYNPGTLPDHLSIKQLLSEGYNSRPRNCQITELFKDAGMFEEYGYGIKKIYSAFADKGLRPPEFIKLPGRLIVRVFGNFTANMEEEKKEVAKNLPVQESVLDDEDDFDIDQEQMEENVDIELEQENAAGNFSDREQQILSFMLVDNHISLNEIAQKLDVSKRTILRDIKKMKQENTIERIGNEKNGYWKINSLSFS